MDKVIYLRGENEIHIGPLTKIDFLTYFYNKERTNVKELSSLANWLVIAVL